MTQPGVELKPGLPDHWRTLHPLGQWANKHKILTVYDAISKKKKKKLKAEYFKNKWNTSCGRQENLR